MFDISFSELVVIAVVALLVVGPDKLPQLARTVGAFVGRLQRYVAQVKEEVNREVRFEELQNLQQEIKEGKRNVEASMMDSIQDSRATVSSLKNSIHSVSDQQTLMTTVADKVVAEKNKTTGKSKQRKADAHKNEGVLKSQPKRKTSKS